MSQNGTDPTRNAASPTRRKFQLDTPYAAAMAGVVVGVAQLLLPEGDATVCILMLLFFFGYFFCVMGASFFREIARLRNKYGVFEYKWTDEYYVKAVFPSVIRGAAFIAGGALFFVARLMEK